MAPLNHLIHLCLVSFEEDFHPAIPSILHPALQAQKVSHLLRVDAEEDPLNPSFNNDPRPNFFHIDLSIITGLI